MRNPTGTWHPGGLRFSRRNLLVPLFCPSICTTYHTLPLPVGISSKASTSPCTGATTESTTHCGLEATGMWPLPVPEAKKLVRKGKGEHQWEYPAGPPPHLFLLPEIMGLGLWHFRLCLHHHMPLSVSLGPVSSPVIRIAAPGSLASV